MNQQAEGKHHIGDFLPPEELKKFMEKYDSKLNDREPDISDYKEYKLKEDNIGEICGVRCVSAQHNFNVPNVDI